MAERLLQAGLDQAVPGGFVVTSAGTRAMVGEPMQPLSAEVVRTYGGTPNGFAARQLTPAILREADLVLTMTAGHRGEVLRLDATRMKRTFPIREFARMLSVLDDGPASDGSADGAAADASGADDGGQGAGVVGSAAVAPELVLAGSAEHWRSLAARASGVRHLSLAQATGDDDVIDPYRRPAETYRQMEDELSPAIMAILRHARLAASGVS